MDYYSTKFELLNKNTLNEILKKIRYKQLIIKSICVCIVKILINS